MDYVVPWRSIVLAGSCGQTMHEWSDSGSLHIFAALILLRRKRELLASPKLIMQSIYIEKK